MKKAFFITVEGGDGAGKTTQLDFIRSYLAEKGEEVLFTREPGGTPVGEAVRAILLNNDYKEMAPLTEALLYAACRAQIVTELIRPALERGVTVVCDRYLDSSMAYQGYARELGDCVEEINRYAVEDCMPDLTILLKLDPEAGLGRVEQRETDRLEEEGRAFHRRVYEGYLELERRYPERIVGIDGSRPIEEVSRSIAHCLDRLLEQR